jgi:serpin B
MGMAHAGAAGSTQNAIQTGLRLPANMTLEQINKSYQSIMRVLPGLDPKTTVSLANAVWYRQQLSLHTSFDSICREYFEAEIKGMDFNDNRTVDTINNWVYDKTRGKIESIVQAPLDANTMAILTNAIYFKGDWKYAFDPQDTESRPFTTVGGGQVMTDMMYVNTDSLLDTGTGKPDTTVLYGETELFQAASLPYGNGSLRMTVLMPKQDYSSEDIIADFSADKWDDWRAGLHSRGFELALPRFRFKCEQVLNDQLSAMGMGEAFRPFDANFDSMFVDLQVFISKVLQKSFVQVDEVGTEAAAVTAVVIGTTNVDDKYIVCNRPFLFVIHESTTGTILFMGRVAEPVWEA